jgi:hypothetical protein
VNCGTTPPASSVALPPESPSRSRSTAELGPLRDRRSHWTSSASLVDRLTKAQSDPQLDADLRALSGETDELGPIE